MIDQYIYNKSPWDEDGPSRHQPGPKKNKVKIEDVFTKNHIHLEDFYKKFGQFKNQGKPKFALTIVFALFFLWLCTGFYVVDEGEQALVMMFGKYVRTANTGLNYHLPSPIEHIIKEKVETLRKEEIGFRSVASGSSYENQSGTHNVPQESLMLTGDENIVDINFIVQWKIINLKDFVFNIYNTRDTVRSAAESAMREVIGVTPIDNAISDGRSTVENEAKQLLQSILNSYHSGVEITSLKLLRADPPVEVIDAFRDVQTAKTDKEREINRAYAYYNELIPKARGEAARILLEAEAFKKEVVEKAEGDAARFSLVLEQYLKAKDITKKRIYLDTMQEILNGMDKTIIDGTKTNGIVPYLPLKPIENTR